MLKQFYNKLYFLKNYFQEITVFSWDPEYTMRFHHVKSISHFSPIEVIREIKTSDTFVVGGELIDDSGGGLTFRLSKPFISKILGKKVIISAVSAKPIKFEVRKFLLRKILSKFELITLRDKFSYLYFKKLGLKNIHLVSDPAALIKSAPTSDIERIFKKYEIKKNKRIISVCLHPQFQQKRGWSVRKIYNEEILLEALPEAFDNLIDKGFQLIFIPTQISRVGDDRILAYKIRKKMKYKDSFKIIEELYSPEEIKGIIKQSELLLSMKFHPLVFAISEGIPTIAITCENLSRVKNFHKEMNLDRFTLNLDELTSKMIIKKVEDLVLFKSKIKSIIQLNAEKLKKRAQKNFKLIEKYIA
ncbi:MAG: polysaccharide pyruvyl transferase family protein [Candidatus Aenigmarchaeota archaeon]|nr:polysaccharide pyruvyl transferase family protein [Candidatus Aenigmarchaeota archaeon]